MENFSESELNALIADRHGNTVYTRTVEGIERFYLVRNGQETGPADYSTVDTLLKGEQAAGVVPDDATGRALYDRLTRVGLTPYGRAGAWVEAFVASPAERLALIRSRIPPM